MRAAAGAELSALVLAPERRAGSASHLFPDATSPWLSELGRQIWDLPDGRIIFASVILCARARVLLESRGRGEDRDGEQTPIGLCPSCLSQPGPVPGLGASPGRPAAGTRRSSATPPVQPRPRGPEARS